MPCYAMLNMAQTEIFSTKPILINRKVSIVNRNTLNQPLKSKQVTFLILTSTISPSLAIVLTTIGLYESFLPINEQQCYPLKT